MPRRAASPALSEQEFDISNALLAGQDGNDSDASEDFAAQAAIPKPNARLDQILSDDDESDDDEAFIAAQQAASNRKNASVKGKSARKSGGFQSMGLNPQLLKAITRKGFSVPTPIQRKTVPLLLDGQDVVGMARTGSGKTAAFVIPMVERLRSHSVKVGARAIVMSPSRELALQTLKAVKDFGRGTDLKTILLVGGDSLEEQFAQMTTNPDIIIATPGRFLHLMVEMSLDLSAVRYVVFDEADRLFEMGFSTQLTEILYALPPSRQTMLFSATLPKSLVEFARAGLKDPNLVRLDAESKVSPDLESAFFTLKSADKEGALLHLLNDIIGIPQGQPKTIKESKANVGKKRKRESVPGNSLDTPTLHSTIIFAATKHHVEYLAQLLRLAGFAVSYVYGSLDQTARKMQVDDFRAGSTNILVVTDVAARGIDIPMLANVINYDFPSQPKIYVHRVGRTARAGRKGWSYSLVQNVDLPYLLDLQLFLGKALVTGRNPANDNNGPNFAEELVLGAMKRTELEKSSEWVTKILDDDPDLQMLRSVSVKGERLYTRSRNAASAESVKRAKKLGAEGSLQEMSRFYARGGADAEEQDVLSKRDEMLARISGFRPAETVFEIGRRGTATETTETIRRTREKISARQAQAERAASSLQQPDGGHASVNGHGGAEDTDEDGSAEDVFAQEDDVGADVDVDMEEASDDELEVTFPTQRSADGPDGANAWQDSEHFMGYTPRAVNVAEDRGYGVHSGGTSKSHNGPSNFVDAARGATMDLAQDEARGFGLPSKPNQMRWDKRSKNYVARVNDEDGSKGAKFIAGESGQKIAASFKSGRFDAWRKAHKLDRMPRTGDVEKPSSTGGPGAGNTGRGGYVRRGARGGHFSARAPKRPDKYRDDYHAQKAKLVAARERAGESTVSGRGGAVARGGRAKSDLRSAEDIRKARQLKEKRRDKNARPSKKKRKV